MKKKSGVAAEICCPLYGARRYILGADRAPFFFRSNFSVRAILVFWQMVHEGEGKRGVAGKTKDSVLVTMFGVFGGSN